MTVSEHANRANGSKVGSDDDRKILKQGYFEVFNHIAAYVPPTPYFLQCGWTYYETPYKFRVLCDDFDPSKPASSFSGGRNQEDRRVVWSTQKPGLTSFLFNQFF
jgi:hypothetical protein